MRRRY